MPPFFKKVYIHCSQFICCHISFSSSIISQNKKPQADININLGRTFMSVLPPNFRFLCTLSIRDFSDIASYVNGGTPLKPTKIYLFGSQLRGCFHISSMKIRTNHLLSVKSLISTIPRQSLFVLNL